VIFSFEPAAKPIHKQVCTRLVRKANCKITGTQLKSRQVAERRLALPSGALECRVVLVRTAVWSEKKLLAGEHNVSVLRRTGQLSWRKAEHVIFDQALL
jgi:hypothetical protein